MDIKIDNLELLLENIRKTAKSLIEPYKQIRQEDLWIVINANNIYDPLLGNALNWLVDGYN